METDLTDRGRLSPKRHIVVDAWGISLVILVSGANPHDSKRFEKCVDAILGLAGAAPQKTVEAARRQVL